MKKIIDGKKYDTETATELGTYWNGKSRRDFEFFEETLYVKRTGEYFIYGIGGPASRYAVSSPSGGWDGGERIVPTSYENAKQFAEEKLTTDEYEKAFGVVTEGEDDIITVKVSPETGSKLRNYARENGMTLTAAVESLVEKI